MGKSLFALLLFAFNLAAIAPSSARAATLYGGGYVSVGVPDLEQAVAFFQDVLDCRLIGPESAVAEASSDDVPASRLLSCDAGSVIELFDNRGISPSPASGRAERPLQFVSDDVQHASEWLRHMGVNVSGSPHRLTSGPLAGRMVLDFVSPWGLRLQLLGSDASAPAGGSLATVDGG
ncbi:glyoxalase [Rhodanobacter sp. Soil772]|uniref:VOC family protein n=1 Tax=Rhodanobacter sp. Soil772 TaxID=1736406 RepID=UPI0006FF903C|nr:VOC family protein [Rhodanobacter sp. Soil772]KRE87222.1 glyoxalase [Rhodanobacter sp. Soil772]